MNRKRDFSSIKQESTAVTCPICQNDIDGNVSVATPNTCSSHIFCVDCLLHWTKNSNVVCPIDRQKYTEVHIFNSLNSKKSKKSSKPDRILKVDTTGTFKNNKNYIISTGTILEPEELTQEELLNTFLNNIVCKSCGGSDEEQNLLLCDGCDVAVHIHCLDPPLTEIPEGDYFCSDCAQEFLYCEKCGSGEAGEKMVVCDGCDKSWHIYCLKNKLDKLPEGTEWYCDDCWRWEVEEVRGVALSGVRESRTRNLRSNSSRGGSNSGVSSTVQNMIDEVISRINMAETHVRTTVNNRNSIRTKKQTKREINRRKRKSRGRRKTSKKITVQKIKHDGFSEPSKTEKKVEPLIYGSKSLGFYEIDPTAGTSKQGSIPAPKIEKVVKGIDRKSSEIKKLMKMPPCPIRIQPPKPKVQKSSSSSSSFLDDLLNQQDAMLNTKKYKTTISDSTGKITSSKIVRKSYF